MTLCMYVHTYDCTFLIYATFVVSTIVCTNVHMYTFGAYVRTYVCSTGFADRVEISFSALQFSQYMYVIHTYIRMYVCTYTSMYTNMCPSDSSIHNFFVCPGLHERKFTL